MFFFFCLFFALVSVFDVSRAQRGVLFRIWFVHIFCFLFFFLFCVGRLFQSFSCLSRSRHSPRFVVPARSIFPMLRFIDTCSSPYLSSGVAAFGFFVCAAFSVAFRLLCRSRPAGGLGFVFPFVYGVLRFFLSCSFSPNSRVLYVLCFAFVF